MSAPKLDENAMIQQIYPWTMVGLTLGLSMAGNAVHATMAHSRSVTGTTAALAALVPPVLAAGALHQLLRVWRRDGAKAGRLLVILLVALVFGMSFALSYYGLHALTIAIGIPPELAWMGPLVVDVTTVAAVADAMLLHTRPVVELAPDGPASPTGETAPVEAGDAEDDESAAAGRGIEDAEVRRVTVCSEIAATLAAGGQPIVRRLAVRYGLPESTVRSWRDKVAAGEWEIHDGEILTREGARVS